MEKKDFFPPQQQDRVIKHLKKKYFVANFLGNKIKSNKIETDDILLWLFYL